MDFTNPYSVLADLSENSDSEPSATNSAPQLTLSPTPDDPSQSESTSASTYTTAVEGKGVDINSASELPGLTMALAAPQANSPPPTKPPTAQIVDWLETTPAAGAHNQQTEAANASAETHALAQVDGAPSEVAATSMATSANINYGDGRRNLASPRPRGRENQKNIPCRNITIYGNCRYENEGCAFNHDRSAFAALAPPNSSTQSVQFTSRQGAEGYGAYLPYRSAVRTRMNADSPSFTPAQTSPNGGQAARSTAISPKAANAAVFTPKTNKSSKMTLWRQVVEQNIAPNLILGPLASTLQAREPQEFKPRGQNDVQQQQIQPQIPAAQDYTQQSYDQSHLYPQHDPNAVANIMATYDPFTNAAIQGIAHPQQQAQINPYAQDISSIAGTSNFYNATTEFQQPVSKPFHSNCARTLATQWGSIPTAYPFVFSEPSISLGTYNLRHRRAAFSAFYGL